MAAKTVGLIPAPITQAPLVVAGSPGFRPSRWAMMLSISDSWRPAAPAADARDAVAAVVPALEPLLARAAEAELPLIAISAISTSFGAVLMLIRGASSTSTVVEAAS